jgi:hypothetical protein
MNKKIAIAIALVLFGGAAAAASFVQAEPPYVEKAMGPWVSARVDYQVPASAARIDQGQAIRAARLFGQGTELGRVHSVRLASFNHPLEGPRLVWVIDLAGLNIKGFGGADGHPAPDITRAVILVSATEPDNVIAMYSFGE